MGRQYVRQSSPSAARAFCSSVPKLAAERIRLQRVVTNSRGSPAPSWPFFPFTNEHCCSAPSIQAEKLDTRAPSNIEHSTSDVQHRMILPAEGLEPTRSCDHWILSPARLPIPPRRQREPETSEKRWNLKRLQRLEVARRG